MIRYKHYKKIVEFLYKKFWCFFFSRKFAHFGCNVSIIFPDIISGEERISLFDNVYIGRGAWLMTLNALDNPQLRIGSRSYLGRFCHIVAIKKVEIEERVLIADKVYISDNYHRYEDVATPIIEAPIGFAGEVVIGEGSWLGENVCVIGAKVGRHCIVGANSVVTRDIPDYCIAIGAPARVVKVYDHSIGKWVFVKGGE